MPSVHTRTYAAPVGLLGILSLAGLTMCRSDRAPAGARPGPRVVADAGARVDAGTVRDVPAVDVGVARDVPAVDAGPPISVLGRSTLNQAPLAGLTVEVVGRPGAGVVTGADGAFRLSFPNGAPLLLRGSHANTRTLQETINTSADLNGLTFDPPTDAQFAEVLSTLSLTEDPAAGTLFIHYHLARGTRLASGLGATLSATGGVRFAMTGDSAVRQETTTVTGDLLLGVINLPVGEVTVTPVTPPRVTCVPERGPATTRIDAHVITNLNFRCR